eukprot:gene3617-biopygen3202
MSPPAGRPDQCTEQSRICHLKQTDYVFRFPFPCRLGWEVEFPCATSLAKPASCRTSCQIDESFFGCALPRAWFGGGGVASRTLRGACGGDTHARGAPPPLPSRHGDDAALADAERGTYGPDLTYSHHECDVAVIVL